VSAGEPGARPIVDRRHDQAGCGRTPQLGRLIVVPLSLAVVSGVLSWYWLYAAYDEGRGVLPGQHGPAPAQFIALGVGVAAISAAIAALRARSWRAITAMIVCAITAAALAFGVAVAVSFAMSDAWKG